MLRPYELDTQESDSTYISENKDYKEVRGHLSSRPRRLLIVTNAEQALSKFKEGAYHLCLEKWIIPYMKGQAEKRYGAHKEWSASLFWKYSLMFSMMLPMSKMMDNVEKAKEAIQET